MRTIAAVLCRIPYRAALFAGWCAAWFTYHVVRFRVAEAKRRIREIFGNRFSKREVDRIAWISLRNFIFTIVETIRLPVSTPAWLTGVIDVNRNAEVMGALASSGKGGIIATSHMGSWELAALSCLNYKIPLFSLGAQQKNKLVDDFYNRSRAGTGFETVLRTPSVLKVIIRKIRQGKWLAILPDVRGKTDALPVRFLGKTANVAGGMGFIARQTNTPVFPTIITRIGWGFHRYRVFDPIYPDQNADKYPDALRITQAFFDILNEFVQAEPEQWLWYNKRWLFDPLSKEETGSRKSAVNSQ